MLGVDGLREGILFIFLLTPEEITNQKCYKQGLFFLFSGIIEEKLAENRLSLNRIAEIGD
ncbi:hypothetical protein TRIP_C90443 [Candidatus Zixiibacteriota bacterium]|nr:hypothetical protein TRIP_C90443 [candidate division Zixibacteria bacterium]